MASCGDGVRRLETMLRSVGAGELLSESILTQMHRCPQSDALGLLTEMLEAPDNSIKAHALDAILHMKNFDKVGFLIQEIYTTSDGNWRLRYCRSLASFRDARGLATWCKLLATDEDPDIRFVAAELLGELGGAEALPYLEQAIEYDDGEDYEGCPVAQVAGEAVRRIHHELGTRVRIDDWMARQSPVPLRELLIELPMLDEHLTIFLKGRGSWSGDTLAVAVPSSDNVTVLMAYYDMNYLMGTSLARQVLHAYSDQRGGQTPSLDEACAVVIRYADRGDLMS